MNRKSKNIAAMLVLFTAAILIATAAFLSCRYAKPLTPSETALVGFWSLVSISDQKILGEVMFGSDRTFRTTDGEFIRQWWLNSGQLRIKIWRDEPTNLPFVKALKNVSADTEIWQLALNENGDRAELSLPGNPPDAELVRSR